MHINELKMGQVGQRHLTSKVTCYAFRASETEVILFYKESGVISGYELKHVGRLPCDLVKYHDRPGWLHYRIDKHLKRLKPRNRNRKQREHNGR